MGPFYALCPKAPDTVDELRGAENGASQVDSFKTEEPGESYTETAVF